MLDKDTFWIFFLYATRQKLQWFKVRFFLESDFSYLVDPVNGHPLLLVAHLVEGLHHLPEGLIEVLIHDDHVEVFLVLPLDEAALLDGGN